MIPFVGEQQVPLGFVHEYEPGFGAVLTADFSQLRALGWARAATSRY
jgi:hypothetical protein